jgi:hypothetical protein
MLSWQRDKGAAFERELCRKLGGPLERTRGGEGDNEQPSASSLRLSISAGTVSAAGEIDALTTARLSEAIDLAMVMDGPSSPQIAGFELRRRQIARLHQTHVTKPTPTVP